MALEVPIKIVLTGQDVHLVRAYDLNLPEIAGRAILDAIHSRREIEDLFECISPANQVQQLREALRQKDEEIHRMRAQVLYAAARKIPAGR